MPRSHLSWDGGLLHVVGATIPGAGIAGVKTWTWTPRGARPIVIVFSTVDGSLRGVVEASTLGRIRTAAAAGLGTQMLARDDASVLAIIGTGRQALAQVQAVVAVRPIREVRVFGRDPGRRAAFARRVHQELADVVVTEHPTAEAAVASADIVTTITRSAEPVLHGDALRDGMHVNAVGAIVPTSSELDEEAIRRCTIIAVESRQQAESDAGDLRAAAQAGALRWDDVLEFQDVVQGQVTRRRNDTTLVRTLGVGLEDLAVASAILEQAEGEIA